MLSIMRLKNPGTIDAAIETVRVLSLEYGNPFNGHDPSRLQLELLRWYTNAEAQLGNHFASFSLIDDLRAAYQQIADLNPGRPAIFNMALSREREDLGRRLEAALAAVRALKEFTGRPGHPVILDTSAFMEGEFFTEFDWHTLDQTVKTSPVRLIVPALVVEELDNLKRSGDKRLKQQARRVLKTLWEFHRPDPKKPVTLPQHTDVTIEVFLDDGWHLRQPNNDAEIIDQAVQVNELLGQKVILASCDYLQLYRSAYEDLAIVLMPRADDAATSATGS